MNCNSLLTATAFLEARDDIERAQSAQEYFNERNAPAYPQKFKLQEYITPTSLNPYDLHTHSYYSDGQHSPTELVNLAVQQNIKLLALTDHDTVNGVKEAQQAATLAQIHLVTGVEVSCLYEHESLKKEIHVLGLNLDINSPPLQRLLAFQQEKRRKRAALMIRRLTHAGLPQLVHFLEKIPQEISVTRMHLVQQLAKVGLASNAKDAFTKFLAQGKLGYVKSEVKTMSEVIGVIKEAKGVAVLAHPLRYALNLKQLGVLIEHFVQAGGEGVELLSGKKNTHQYQTFFLEACQKWGLYASCGSDFHSIAYSGVPGLRQPLPKTCHPIWSKWLYD